MRFEWILVTSLALTLGAAVLPGAAYADDEAAAHDVVDRNDDGVIDRGEFRVWVIEIYYLADDDKDGTLTRKELEEEPGVFDAADANRDDKVTLREFENAHFGDFEAADTNDDGVVSLSEHESFNEKVESEGE
jgi:hypothetical protein